MNDFKPISRIVFFRLGEIDKPLFWVFSFFFLNFFCIIRNVITTQRKLKKKNVKKLKIMICSCFSMYFLANSVKQLIMALNFKWINSIYLMQTFTFNIGLLAESLASQIIFWPSFVELSLQCTYKHYKTLPKTFS